MEKELPKLSISELFAPLAKRLFELENLQTKVVLDLDGTDMERRIQAIMDSIASTVDEYESQDIVIKCKSYLDRIDKLKSTLKVGDSYEYSWYDAPNEEYFTKTISRTKEEKKTALRNAKEGLDYCSKQLLGIESNHANAKSSTTPTIVNEIKLPDSFTVTDLQKYFEHRLNLRQAALFLSYLREHGVIPNYSAVEMGKLGEIFFGRHSQNIRREVGKVHQGKNSADLIELQKILNSILEDIKNDLKKNK